MILRRAHAALVEGGRLVLEPHTFAAVKGIGEEGRSWSSSKSGLFSDQPHLYLREGSWDDACHAATMRHFIMDARTGEVTRYAASYQAYHDSDYRALLTACGFREIEFFPSLAGFDASPYGLIAIAALK